jgi:cobalt-precorrin-5B (C1)-methyltransferase
MTKLAQGFLDLHSRAGAIDFRWLAERLEELGAGPDLVAAAAQSNTAAHVLEVAARADLPIASRIALGARATAERVLQGSAIRLDIAVFDRDGRLLASAG